MGLKEKCERFGDSSGESSYLCGINHTQNRTAGPCLFTPPSDTDTQMVVGFFEGTLFKVVSDLDPVTD